MRLLNIYLFIILLIPLFAISQEPFFSPFEGNVYAIPKNEVEKGHGEHVYDNEILTFVTMETIEIDSRDDKVLFPGVDRKDKFGLVLYSTFYVPTDGCYSLMLASDDGSKLWLDEQLIINNDSPHKMRVKVDSIGLKRGEYPAKLWYYNAYRPKYGLVLKSKYMSDNLDCSEKKVEAEILVLQSDVLFGFEEHVLVGKTIPSLDSIARLIDLGNYTSLSISGHTDNVGTDKYNLKLSLQRAVEVRTYLERKCDLTTVEIKIFGLGENKPLLKNNSKESRAKNRRVEIVLER